MRVSVQASCGSLIAVTDPPEMIAFELTDDERTMLRCGLSEWGGPACCTTAMAVAMGFEDVRDLFSQADRLRAELEAGRPLSRWDWTRMLLATEIVFASDVIGSGVEWPTTTGLDDQRSIAVLRGLQRKLVKACVPIGARGIHSEP
jgi:hypothetical protein